MTGLRLLDNPRPSSLPVISADAPGIAPAGIRCRPSDRRQTISLDRTPAITTFAAAAADMGLSIEQASAIVAEHHLVLADAVTLGLRRDQAQAALCAATDHARATLPLTPASAAYLRELGARSIPWAGEIGEMSGRVAFPTRLIERMPPDTVVTILNPDAVAEALAWERAAVLSGRTMSEWAMFVLLASAAG